MDAGEQDLDPLIGQLVAGRYEVLRLLGRGGMGRVYLVLHVKLGRTFAMKKLAPMLARHPDAVARFQREADIIARLRHPNIVEATDWEVLSDGSPCIVMEYLSGEDLAALIHRAGPLPWPDLARIGDQVMGALETAHEAGVVHRDLKPQNVFIARYGGGESRAKLLDFGVSKVMRGSAALSQTGDAVLGTPNYMSPEQATGKRELIGPSADVWAMGVMLYEMATAQLPFDADDPMSVLYRICNGTPDPMSSSRSDAPGEFVDLVEASLSRDTARRIQTMGELRRRFRDALRDHADSSLAMLTPSPTVESHLPLRAGPSGPAPGAPTTIGRASGEITGVGDVRPGHRWVWIATAAAATLLLAAGIGWLAGRTDETLPPANTIGSARSVPALSADGGIPDARLAHIEVSVRNPPAGLSVLVDSVPVDGARVVVPKDGRRHVVTAAAPGYQTRQVEIDDASDSIELELVRAKRTRPAVKRKKPRKPPPPLAP